MCFVSVALCRVCSLCCCCLIMCLWCCLNVLFGRFLLTKAVLLSLWFNVVFVCLIVFYVCLCCCFLLKNVVFVVLHICCVCCASCMLCLLCFKDVYICVCSHALFNVCLSFDGVFVVLVVFIVLLLF